LRHRRRKAEVRHTSTVLIADDELPLAKNGAADE
jgi:hypothetical protein